VKPFGELRFLKGQPRGKGLKVGNTGVHKKSVSTFEKKSLRETSRKAGGR